MDPRRTKRQAPAVEITADELTTVTLAMVELSGYARSYQDVLDMSVVHVFKTLDYVQYRRTLEATDYELNKPEK